MSWNTCNLRSVFFIFCAISCLVQSQLTVQQWADHYETEIDLREPSSFKNWQILVVRQTGFNRITHSLPDGSQVTDPVDNSEAFAAK